VDFSLIYFYFSDCFLDLTAGSKFVEPCILISLLSIRVRSIDNS
jgi:hypothetical protein